MFLYSLRTTDGNIRLRTFHTLPRTAHPGVILGQADGELRAGRGIPERIELALVEVGTTLEEFRHVALPGTDGVLEVRAGDAGLPPKRGGKQAPHDR